MPEQSQFLCPGVLGGAGADQDGAQEAEAALAWSRLPGQACKIPTSLLTTLESGARWESQHISTEAYVTLFRGVSALAFSSDGRRLAVAASNQATATIRLFR